MVSPRSPAPWAPGPPPDYIYTSPLHKGLCYYPASDYHSWLTCGSIIFLFHVDNVKPFIEVLPFLWSYSPIKRLVMKRTHSAADTKQTWSLGRAETQHTPTKSSALINTFARFAPVELVVGMLASLFKQLVCTCTPEGLYLFDWSVCCWRALCISAEHIKNRSVHSRPRLTFCRELSSTVIV